MSHFAVLPIPPATPRGANRGVSDESATVDMSYATAFRWICNSIDKQAAIGKTRGIFLQLLQDHSAPGWDGEGANATSLDAVSRSYEFVSNLPPRLSNPDVSVNRYGDVELEWYVRPDKLFTLAVGDGGRYHFASLNGMERRSGAGYIGGVPPEILLGIVNVLTT